MEPSKAGHLMSLAALQRQDPYINNLLDVTGQVALYNFNSKANEWEKTEIEGTLFVYSRSALPRHGFTIMNRLSAENLVEPINKDLEFQLQDPFLLYRNANLGIYSIWFYDKSDCQRIAQLMVKIVKLEADYAQSQSPGGPRPGKTNGVAEPRPIDILELLSKAKEEYHKAQPGESITETKTMPTVVSSPRAQSAPQPDKISHMITKQITVEELFGSSVSKDPSLPAMPAQSVTPGGTPCEPASPSASSYLQGRHYAPPDPLPPPHLPAPDPSTGQRQLVPGLLPAPASYGLQPGPVRHPVGPGSDTQPRCLISPLMVLPVGVDPRPAAPAATAQSCAPQAYLGHDVLSTLKPALPSVNADIHNKPGLAPNFLPSNLVPPHSFQELLGKPLLRPGKEMEGFSQAPNRIKAMAGSPVSQPLAGSGLGPGLSVLLSPSAFQHSPSSKPTTDHPRRSASALSAAASTAASSSSSSTTTTLPPPPSTSDLSPEAYRSACSKAKLQETLVHLIKTDPAFLSTIHEAYRQSLAKDFSNMGL
ncbi:mRNA-decapping enzyme 1A isoform X1 [Gadus morhua]|uniref:mRNA-decapping enzyme 1A isoform X1 n=2 Tax=Gadus morhua TaxID=8049 RepID=UPI0011B77AFA|nr:mRNA-decapping enzyme 1A isoform X1 [Gadus morhua]